MPSLLTHLWRRLRAKAAPLAVHGRQGSGPSFLDAFRRTRPPTPLELLAELKERRWRTAHYVGGPHHDRGGLAGARHDHGGAAVLRDALPGSGRGDRRHARVGQPRALPQGDDDELPARGVASSAAATRRGSGAEEHVLEADER